MYFSDDYSVLRACTCNPIEAVGNISARYMSSAVYS